MNTLPKYTIFLPVKNGGEYLRVCVESILAQSYRNFDLIILENQSMDGGAEWLQDLAKEDPRVKIVPSDKSLSIEDNWQRILSTPKNEFMTMIGHDDLFDLHFLEEVNRVILEKPDANLYLTHFRLIDSNGNLIRHCAPMPKSETAADFLAARMAEIRDSFGTGYVMRSEDYDRVGGIPNYPSLLYADEALWLKLIGSGLKITSARICFSYRLHVGSTSGKPNYKALFLGLKLYLKFLQNLAQERADVARIIELYGSQYVTRRCQGYYYQLMKNTPWGKQIKVEILSELRSVLILHANEIPFDESGAAFGRKMRLKYWMSSIVKRMLGTT